DAAVNRFTRFHHAGRQLAAQVLIGQVSLIEFALGQFLTLPRGEELGKIPAGLNAEVKSVGPIEAAVGTGAEASFGSFELKDRHEFAEALRLLDPAFNDAQE